VDLGWRDDCEDAELMGVIFSLPFLFWFFFVSFFFSPASLRSLSRYARAAGFRTNASTTDLALILPEELEATLKAAAELSMGTEISDSDIAHIHSLCDQVISITEYRTQLSEYLRNRMAAIAPNLTALVGELVGARLISHSGSLMNLAKHPASTIQILGAEKALFRALKTKHDTPKYGLIYHVSEEDMEEECP
jgi:nucleolar protein 58